MCLRELVLADVYCLGSLAPLATCPLLASLSIFATESTAGNLTLDIASLGLCKAMRTIHVRGFRDIGDVSPLAGHTTLEHMKFEGVERAQNIHQLNSCPSLTKVTITTMTTVAWCQLVKGLGDTRGFTVIADPSQLSVCVYRPCPTPTHTAR